jgi:hypothetical protein
MDLSSPYEAAAAAANPVASARSLSVLPPAPQRSVHDIGQVMVDAALHLRVGLTAMAMDLRRAGDARWHTMAIRVAGNQGP